jgi:tellurite resistance protein
MSSAHAPALAAHAASAAARIPCSFFSIVLGLGALGAAWRAAARAYRVSPWLADALLAASVALFLGLLAAQVAKAVTAPGRLRAELRDPVEGSLAALAPASLLLLSAGLGVHFAALARVVFWVGAAAQLALALYAVGRWLTARMDADLVTPALYLPPAAGSLLAAVAAGAVGQREVGWLFFGAGVVSWLVLGAVLLGRHLSAGELAAPHRPLLALELAPPALALLAWQGLAGAAPDPTASGLLGVGLFQALLLLRLAGRLRDVPFAPSYWTLAFPLALLSAATLRMAGATPSSPVAGALALPLFVVANAVVSAVAFRTVAALTRGTLLPRE